MSKIIFTILILVFTELKMEDLCFEDQKTATCFMIVTQVSGIPAFVQIHFINKTERTFTLIGCPKPFWVHNRFQQLSSNIDFSNQNQKSFAPL